MEKLSSEQVSARGNGEILSISSPVLRGFWVSRCQHASAVSNIHSTSRSAERLSGEQVSALSHSVESSRRREDVERLSSR